ncbi:hypothetical protein H9C73_03205 [Marinobacterium sp. AK62]|uniref:Tryptophan synthase subunit beta like protein n=1 Tax=Marinobacterium alkalitolerans TaxID=1542925 RepID=A0ABS3Z7Z6_9GAMM|nr:hypothetical protein [Marinobacterium alkalitolerans]MBP0047731.1 hypothetical protein [Marinobacterium alkalitolerans]
MLFALRDESGNITALTDRNIPGATAVDAADPEVLSFLSLDASAMASATDFLEDSDLSTIRILEDLVDTLVDRQVIRFTDLPPPAQRKLLSRKVARTLNSDEDDRFESVEEDKLFLHDEDQLF